MRRLVAKIMKAAIIGVLEGAVLVAGYIYVLPWALKQLLGPYQEALRPVTLTATYIATISIVIGLSAAGRALEDTIFSPILRGSSGLFAYLAYVYYVSVNKTISITISHGAVTEKISLNLLPIAASAAMFLLAPSVVIPFLSYFERLSEE